MVSRISFFRFRGKILWYLWIGRARLPGPPSNNLDVEVFNVGGFLTHGDYVLDTDADFVAVVEHRLVPARARSEGKRLQRAGIRSVWAPASLEGGHVGHAGVGVVSLRGAAISLPSIATVGFSEFFQLGRVLRCHLPVSGGRVVHVVVVYGFQGASTDPEKLRLTEKLLDARFFVSLLLLLLASLVSLLVILMLSLIESHVCFRVLLLVIGLICSRLGPLLLVLIRFLLAAGLLAPVGGHGGILFLVVLLLSLR